MIIQMMFMYKVELDYIYFAFLIARIFHNKYSSVFEYIFTPKYILVSYD